MNELLLEIKQALCNGVIKKTYTEKPDGTAVSFDQTTNIQSFDGSVHYTFHREDGPNVNYVYSEQELLFYRGAELYNSCQNATPLTDVEIKEIKTFLNMKLKGQTKNRAGWVYELMELHRAESRQSVLAPNKTNLFLADLAQLPCINCKYYNSSKHDNHEKICYHSDECDKYNKYCDNLNITNIDEFKNRKR